MHRQSHLLEHISVAMAREHHTVGLGQRKGWCKPVEFYCSIWQLQLKRSEHGHYRYENKLSHWEATGNLLKVWVG